MTVALNSIASAQKEWTPCDVCGIECAKYKCPRCPVEFCSARCSKAHRGKHDEPAKPEAPQEAESHRADTETERGQGVVEKADDAAPTAKQKKRKTCGVCNTEAGKYQCPRCPVAFCSASCSKTHREKHPADDRSKPAAGAPPSAQEPAPKRRKTIHPFSVLDDSPELRRLFSKYPKLPSKLEKIYETTLPPKDQPTGRGGLPWKVPPMGPHGRKKEQPWTSDVGLRRGKRALRDARADPSEDGDGVREFCELVIHLLSRVPEVDAPAATQIVQKEVTEQNVQLIKKLIEVEGRREV